MNGGILDFSNKHVLFSNLSVLVSVERILVVDPTLLSFLSYCSLETNYGKIAGFRAFHPQPIFPSSFTPTKHTLSVK